MGRLTERDSKGKAQRSYNVSHSYDDMLEKLAHYEDLEEQLMESAEIDIDNMVGEFMHDYKLKKENRLIELPCAVGDTVWVANPHEELCDSFNITDINITHHGIGFENPYKGRGFNLEWFGRTVFLTKEEAEAKLKELEGMK